MCTIQFCVIIFFYISMQVIHWDIVSIQDRLIEVGLRTLLNKQQQNMESEMSFLKFNLSHLLCHISWFDSVSGKKGFFSFSLLSAGSEIHI